MRKKGSALVLVLAIIALLFVLSASILTMSTSNTNTHLATDNSEKVTLAAKSGIQMGIAKINKEIANQKAAAAEGDNTYKINLDPLPTASFYDNTVICDVSFSTDADLNIIITSVAKLKSSGQYSKLFAYNTKSKVLSGGTGDQGNSGGNTIADYLGNNCLSILGDINDTSKSIQTGVGQNTNITINGSGILQSNSIDIKSNLTINNGSLSMLTSGNIYIENAAIGFTLNSSKAQIQSANSITLGSDITATSSKFSSIVTGSGGTIQFMNNGTNVSLDNNSSAYVQSGGGIQLYQNFKSTGPVTMIATNNIITSNNSAIINMTGTTYLKGASVQFNRTGNPIKLGNAYIEANPFDYSVATIQPQNLSIDGTLKSNGWEPKFNYTLVSAQAQPTEPTLLTTIAPISKFSSTPAYNSKYETKYYNDLPVRIIKGTDKGTNTATLNSILNPQSGEVSPNAYKLLIIDGDCTLDYNMNGSTFNNIIIYCTGTLIGSTSLTSVNFNNSSIMAKNINIQPSNSFTITQPNSSVFSQTFKNEINDIITKVYNNSY